MDPLGMIGQITSTILTNEANAHQASMNREWQGDQERSGREFAERMSSTAHQREVKDLVAAGLNPLLSAGGTGASSPGGSAPSGDSATMQNPLEGLLSSAIEAKRLKKDIEKAEEEIKVLGSQDQKNKAEASLLKTREKVERGGIPVSETKNQLFNKLIKPSLDKIQEMKTNGAKQIKETGNWLENLPANQRYQRKP